MSALRLWCGGGGGGGGARSVLTRWSWACCPRRDYWWGHDTREEAEFRSALEAERRVVRWTTPGKDLKDKQQYTYAPARIMDEALSLGPPEKPFINFNKPELFHELRKPRLPWTDPTFWVQEQMKRRYKLLVQSQIFLRERVVTLGPDLAAAHFLLHRNCRVRFKGHDHWIELDKYQKTDLPNSYQPGWYIEAIDAAESVLIYEGFQNLRNLVFLKYLDLSYAPYIDAWTLDRITGEYKDSLEFLDLSGCPGVNWSGLESLWRLKKLKTLVLYDMEHVKDLKLLCIMLLEVLPNLDIRGVDYIDTKLLEGTEHEHLLEDLDDIKALSAASAEEAAKSEADQPAANKEYHEHTKACAKENSGSCNTEESGDGTEEVKRRN